MDDQFYLHYFERELYNLVSVHIASLLPYYNMYPPSTHVSHSLLIGIVDMMSAYKSSYISATDQRMKKKPTS